MEEEYRIVNGLKLPPKRRVVVKRKVPPSSSAKGTLPTTSIGNDQGSTSSEAHGDQKKELNSSLPFGAIRTVFAELKKKSKCKDIVLPEQPEFQKKWAALAKSIAEKLDKSPNRYDAIALIDCTILGGCEHGALIDKSGIYMVNEDRELTGWLDWKVFIEKAEIARRSAFEISICSQPSVGLDISHCKLTISKAHKLFATVLDRVSGGKAKASQVRAISMLERLRDWAIHGMIILICLPLAALAFWGVKSYAHVKNVEKSLAMYCQSHHLPGYREIVSVDVPRWNMFAFGDATYPCSAKLKIARNGQSDEIVDVTFMARPVSSIDVVKDVTVAVKATDALAKGKIDVDTANKMLDKSDDWDVNMGFWGWLGDDYHILDVKMK